MKGEVEWVRGKTYEHTHLRKRTGRKKFSFISLSKYNLIHMNVMSLSKESDARQTIMLACDLQHQHTKSSVCESV